MFEEKTHPNLEILLNLYTTRFSLSTIVSSSVVSQFYESQVSDEYVIKGNAAVLKCNIPSFVSDHVEVIAWVDTNGLEYLRSDSSGINVTLKLPKSQNIPSCSESKYISI